MANYLDQLKLSWQKIMSMESDQRYRYASHWSWLLSEARSAGINLPPEYEALRKELDEEAMEAQFNNMPV